MKQVCQWLLRLFGWTIQGTAPSLAKYVMIVVPHTSNYDFFLGLAARAALGLKANYLGKEILFRPPWGWIFRKLGGYPVQRDRSRNQVDQVASLIRSQNRFVLAVAPEGTRKRAYKWRTGFYWIARRCRIPIVMVSFDYGKRVVTLSAPFYPTEDQEADFNHMRRFFKGVRGFNPRNCAP